MRARQARVLRQACGELRELVPARRARGDQDREATFLHGARDLVKLQLAQAVVGTRPVLAGLQTKLVHHPAMDPRVVGGRVADVQQRFAEIRLADTERHSATRTISDLFAPCNDNRCERSREYP